MNKLITKIEKLIKEYDGFDHKGNPKGDRYSLCLDIEKLIQAHDKQLLKKDNQES